MCYPEPGPRCSNHAIALYRETKAVLVEADGKYWDAKDALSEAETAQAEAELIRSEPLLKLAQSNHAEATKNYENAISVRDEKLEEYRKAIDAFRESPEGILRFQRAGEHDQAEKYATIRMMKIAEFKRLQTAK